MTGRSLRARHSGGVRGGEGSPECLLESPQGEDLIKQA